MNDPTTILLVEDDRNIALALQIRLRAAGYRVVLGANVAQAKAHVETRVPDVAILDINLPDGNGIELMQDFAVMASTASITTIIMTASRKPGLREHAFAMGACAFLDKPFSSTALLEAVAINGGLVRQSRRLS